MDYLLDTVRLSALAYKEPADIEAEIKNLGFNNFRFVKNDLTNTQCFLCSKENIVYLSFRGTTFDDWEDWATNLDCEFVDCKFGQFFKGFWLDVESVYDEILGVLVAHIVQNRKLIITGHSQGAGDAAAMGVRMLGEHRDVFRVIHYGGPRVVDSDAAYYLDRHFPDVFYRIVNNNDLVTRVPPRVFGFSHFGNLGYFTEDGVFSTDITWWDRFLDRIHGKIADIGEMHLDCLKDHMIDAEYSRLVDETTASRMDFTA